MRGRVLATIGNGTRWLEKPDAPPPESVTGDVGLANISDLREVLDTAAIEIAATDAPEGFRPLPVWAVVEIVRSMQLLRPEHPSDDPLALAYRSSGEFLCGALALDTFGWDSGHKVDPGRVVVVSCVPLPSPIGPDGQYRGRPTKADVLAAACRDGAAVARWWVHPDGRTWRSGTPHPTPPPEPIQVAMSAAAIRAVMRVVRDRVERGLPLAVREMVPTLVFDPTTGQCFGSTYPLDEPYYDRPTDTYLRVRAVDDDPDALARLEDELHRVRIVEPGGRVVVLDTVPSS